VTFFRKNYLYLSLGFLIFLNIFLWNVLYSEKSSRVLTVAFLNIGQGDGIYIESPTHNQLLVDGGPPRAILSELGGVMKFYDRSVDMILVTNPDQDHIGGLIDVLDSYNVEVAIEPGTFNPSQIYKELENAVEKENAKKIIARRGMIIHLGGGAEVHILFPDRDVSELSPNDGSIIARLVYGDTSVMLTGDAPNKAEEYVAELGGELESTILKAGHHGSRTSASEVFVRAVSPEYAVITAGKKNKYGHPHEETLDLFKKLNIPVLGTYEEGRIVFVSDGKQFVRK
jgi:competence protein ComEC